MASRMKSSVHGASKSSTKVGRVPTGSNDDNHVIKTIEGNEANELLKHFKRDIENLGTENKSIRVNISTKPLKVVFQSNIKDDASVEKVKGEVLKWLKDDKYVINTSEKEEEMKIKEYLDTKQDKIRYTLTQPGTTRVFRMQGKKRHLDICMREIHKLLKRPYEPDMASEANETSLSEKTRNKKDSRMSSSQKPDTDTVGHLTREIENPKVQPQSSTRSIISKDGIIEEKKAPGKEKSLKQERSKLVEPLIHLPNPTPLQIQTSSSCKVDVTLQSGLIFKAYAADITKLKIDSIVNPSNENLQNTGGCAYFISKAAGKKFDEDCARIMNSKKKIKVTENVVSVAGNLKCKCVFNAVGPEWGNYDDKKKAKCLEDLLKTVIGVLETAEKEKMSSIAIPPISSGLFGVPADVCAPMYVKAITEFGAKKKSYLREVHFVDVDPNSIIFDLVSTAYHTYLNQPKSLNPDIVMQLHMQQNPPATTKPKQKSGGGADLEASRKELKPRCLFKGKEKEKFTFEMDNKMKIFIYKENIVTLKNIGILVCSENRAVTGTGGLAQNILRNAGQIYQKELKRIQDELRGRHLHPGELRTLPAGDLNYRFVLLTILNRFPHERAPHADELLELEHTTQNVLYHSDFLASTAEKRKKSEHLESLAMPLLGAGKTEHPQHLEMLCYYVYFAIEKFMDHGGGNVLREIHLVSFNDRTNGAFIKVFMERSSEEFRQSRPLPPTARPSSANLNQHKKPTTDNTKVEVWSMEPRKRSSTNIQTYFQSPTEKFLKSLDTCVICLEPYTKPVELKLCHHVFCEECISDFFSRKTACPVCNIVYGKIYGDQPQTGTATVYKNNNPLPGYPKSDTWEILYEFPDGVQEDCHPHPGLPYKGTCRAAYLPATEEGTAVLRMLERAFKQGLTFTVGSSRTTGQSNVVTWNDIHHKTRRNGGPERFGYPDPDYLLRVREELEAKGITENDDREQQ